MQFQFTDLSTQEVEIILACVRKQPLEVVWDIFNKLQQQVAQQANSTQQVESAKINPGETNEKN